MKKLGFVILILSITLKSYASFILIPMDETQTNHLKAYGIAYWVLEKGVSLDWLLNYKGGSFAMSYNALFEKECLIRDVKYQVIPDATMSSILAEIAEPEVNMDAVRLEKPPKVAVYSPKTKSPWDDAVTLALTYAEIPYEVIYDEEIIEGKLPMYDWLHLHHEDFTGQYGKFWSAYKNADWYINQVNEYETRAKNLGFMKVSQEKLAVAQKIRDFVMGGGFMFAMCSATDSYDIALSAAGVDICAQMFDGDGADPNAQAKLNYDNCFAFENFKLSNNPWEYEYSNIDINPSGRDQSSDYFSLFDFSAKWDQVPAMLTQNHERVIKGFMGQTTAFNDNIIKKDVLIMGENRSKQEAKYIHGTFGNGTWTFYGGHDPEDYQHRVGDPPTDLNLHPNSPGYRLILNNILFPAAKKKKQKT
ncbi:MAG: asparagine synthetase B [Chitinophagales bacterium]|nr:asparagine synthetase B [Chitinophagales bacterium]